MKSRYIESVIMGSKALGFWVFKIQSPKEKKTRKKKLIVFFSVTREPLMNFIGRIQLSLFGFLKILSKDKIFSLITYEIKIH